MKSSPPLSLEDEDQISELGPFLGQRTTKKPGPRHKKLIIILILLVISVVIGAISLTVLLSLRYKNVSKALAPSSCVKKVTGVYGDGVWLESSVAHNVTRSRLDKALIIHQEHAKKQGHEQVILRKNLFGERVNNAYTKIGNLLQHNLVEMTKEEGTGAKWLFWHDADTVILNRLISLDIFVANITEMENVNFLYTTDFNGLNAGVFFIRVGEWASLFLANILAIAHPLGTPSLPFWEQDAIKLNLQSHEYFGNAAVEVPKVWFNKYPDLLYDNSTDTYEDRVEPGTFMTHLAGPDKYKEGWFDFYIDAANGTDPRYHNSSAIALLRNDIESFWHTRSNSKDNS